MQELLDQLITPEVRMVLYLMVACVVMLYVLSIVSRMRSLNNANVKKHVTFSRWR